MIIQRQIIKQQMKLPMMQKFQNLDNNNAYILVIGDIVIIGHGVTPGAFKFTVYHLLNVSKKLTKKQ